LALGPTNFALHLTATLQFLLFLLILYFFTRYVFSQLVACGTLALLAAGPGQALFFSMRAGAHARTCCCSAPCCSGWSSRACAFRPAIGARRRCTWASGWSWGWDCGARPCCSPSFLPRPWHSA